MMRPENNEMWATIGNIAREYTVEEGNSDHARNEVARGGVTPPGVEVDVLKLFHGRKHADLGNALGRIVGTGRQPTRGSLGVCRDDMIEHAFLDGIEEKNMRGLARVVVRQPPAGPGV
nr:hypothetical protein Iba_chr12dCG17720 [Ipomoea batatas]